MHAAPVRLDRTITNPRRTIFVFTVVALLAQLVGGCSQVKYRTTTPAGTQTVPAESRTFAVVGRVFPPAGYGRTPHSIASWESVASRAREDLAAHGFREVPADQAALLVRYGIGAQHHAPNQLGGGPRLNSDIELPPYTSVAVVLDVVEGPTARQVWRGEAFTELLPNRTDNERLAEAMRGLVNRFVAETSRPNGSSR